VLVFNGNGGNRAHRAPLAAALSRSGLAVLLFDYRGYGGNPGAPTEPGLLADARAARAYLASRPGVDPGRLVYLGESLGAAVAVALAVEVPPLALVLRSPFTSLATWAACTTRRCRSARSCAIATRASTGSAARRRRCWWWRGSGTG
jgi:fermentation-respiration switch protein FrsA (DUF1100 family)